MRTYATTCVGSVACCCCSRSRPSSGRTCSTALLMMSRLQRYVAGLLSIRSRQPFYVGIKSLCQPPSTCDRHRSVCALYRQLWNLLKSTMMLLPRMCVWYAGKRLRSSAIMCAALNPTLHLCRCRSGRLETALIPDPRWKHET